MSRAFDNKNIQIKLCPLTNSDPVSLCNSGVVDQHSIRVRGRHQPSSHRKRQSRYSCLLSIPSYNDSRDLCLLQCLNHKTALDGAAVHFSLVFSWCDSPTKGFFVPESIDISSRVGSAQRSALSGDECAAPPDWHTSLSSSTLSGFFMTIDRSQASFRPPAVFQFDCQCQLHHEAKRVVRCREDGRC